MNGEHIENDVESDISSANAIPDRGIMADLRRYENDHAISSIECGPLQVILKWGDGHISHFHYGWLRENCPAIESRHPMSMERLIHPLAFPLNLVPLDVSVDDCGTLAITWPALASERSTCVHRSTYDPGWLRAHCYSTPYEVRDIAKPKATSACAVPMGEWDSLMASDSQFLTWLKAMDEVGWSVVGGVPDDDAACVRFGHKIGVIRSSNFGFSFDVRSIPNPNSNAYTALRLPLHTDMPHYELPPGVQLLHCRINSATGGESLMADGLAVSLQLKEHHPEAYELLCSETIPYRFQDSTSDYTARHPIIECNHRGVPIYINWSNSTSAPLDTHYSLMANMRNAIRLFLDYLERPENLIVRKLNPGEMLVFNNRRILHGRNAFDITTGDRHFQGCYLDTSELKSRLAVLTRSTPR